MHLKGGAVGEKERLQFREPQKEVTTGSSAQMVRERRPRQA